MDHGIDTSFLEPSKGEGYQRRQTQEEQWGLNLTHPKDQGIDLTTLTVEKVRGIVSPDPGQNGEAHTG